MCQLMLERSALANDLRRVYHWVKDMSRQSTCRRAAQQDVLLNGWIRLSLPTCAAAVTVSQPARWWEGREGRVVLGKCEQGESGSTMTGGGGRSVGLWLIVRACLPVWLCVWSGLAA